MRFADVRLVIGTRPEAIKLAPVARALADRGHAPSLIWTGQHRALHPAEFGLDAFSSVRLDCSGEKDPHRHVGKVTAALRSILDDQPDLLIVQGDTSSALGAALAGFSTRVAVAHVEAGLRTHDPHSPWPEEEYRTAIDAGADLLFAPTDQAADNLRHERVRGAVHVTGNTGIDALLAAEAGLPSPSRRCGEEPPTLLVTCHRRESWSGGLHSIAKAMKQLARQGARIEMMLHPNAFIMTNVRRLLGSTSGVALIEPCSHAELLRRMRDADLVLSDSGGIQEEAPTLGVPLLVLRDKTERPEGVADGSALLVGTSSERIVAAATRLLGDRAALAAMSCRSFPYGDGRAAGRIAAIIDAWLEQPAAGR